MTADRGSFVSPGGLLLTNHHVARGQLQKNSTPEHDYIKDGFYAATPDQEMKSPDLEVNVLVSMENVTARVQGAVKPGANETGGVCRAQGGSSRRSNAKARRRPASAPTWSRSIRAANTGSIAIRSTPTCAWFSRPNSRSRSSAATPITSPIRVTIWTWPSSASMKTASRSIRDNYLKWNRKGAPNDELVFVSGHPGSTQRLDTMAQLLQERDLVEPNVLKLLKTRIAILKAYSARGPEQARQAASQIFGLENSLKAYQGRYEGLMDKNLIAEEAGGRSRFSREGRRQPRVENASSAAPGTRLTAATAKGATPRQAAVLPQPGFCACHARSADCPLCGRSEKARWRAPAGLS